MKKAQAGILLEVFILILILALFLILWNGFARTTFLAGLFKIDDSSIKHSCANIIPVILSTEYVSTRAGGDETVSELNNYLRIEGRAVSYPTASYIYDKMIKAFPELRGLGVSVTPLGFDEPVTSKGLSIGGLQSLLGTATTCEFPMYSTNKSVGAVVKLVMII